MVKLLVIADDFTGAMDTGVQFQAKGTLVQIDGRLERNPFQDIDNTIQVLIVDTETRHMQPEEAKRVVAHIVACAVERGGPCIYKKTDSALRGNIGSELTAVLQASGGNRLHFIPAFPKMGRVTVDGIHYIDGVPVADSVFGKDPFEPVRQSAVDKIIKEQSDTQTYLVGSKVPDQEANGLLIYDARSEQELEKIASGLEERKELRLLAGCAGFAATLPRILKLEQHKGSLPVFDPSLLTVCGSINPITVEQLDSAERRGVLRIRLTPEQKLTCDWPDGPEGRQCMARWMSKLKNQASAIIDCSGIGDEEETQTWADRLGLDLPGMRQRISDTMGGLLKGLLDLGLESTLLVTGGDTLLAFLRKIGVKSLVPICELVPGVVLSQVKYHNRTYNLISKSGGFGSEELLAELEQIIKKRNQEVVKC